MLDYLKIKQLFADKLAHDADGIGRFESAFYFTMKYVISRFFGTIKAARKWAAWCAQKWPTRIMKGGQGGEVVF